MFLITIYKYQCFSIRTIYQKKKTKPAFSIKKGVICCLGFFFFGDAKALIKL